MAASEVIKEWAAEGEVAVPLAGAEMLRGLRRGRPVSAGERLARHPDPAAGDIHASVNGWISEINEWEIVIARDEAAVGRPPEPVSLAALERPELGPALKELGLARPAVQPGETIIISTLDPEPGLTLARPLFGEHRETMLAGVEGIARLYPGRDLLWAVNRAEEAPPGTEFHLIKGDYPRTLPSLLKKKITGRLDRAGSGVLTGRAIFFLGRAWRTGLPVIRTPLTLGSANYLAPVGARIMDLLTFANLAPGPGDLVVAGGLVRGVTLARLERGVSPAVAALHLVRSGRAAADDICRQCGECARVCPAGLPIDRLARRDPSAWLSQPGWEALTGCLVCGACALACPARRPLLSLIRLVEGLKL
ncbi:MAG: 4Fe-4S dicluster domain-containing protein [Candidatus Adiutrix sp.]|jgi:electron transport complex protein RnfC|nr:4Fe-4S dicluster domain-containing protein [Candidatus Adiutrix sp.]